MPVIRELSLGPAIAGAVVFLFLGFLGFVMPYAVQRYALRLYQYPGDEHRARFLQSHSYIVMLRVIGFAFLAVGLALATVIVAAFAVPGFAEFR